MWSVFKKCENEMKINEKVVLRFIGPNPCTVRWELEYMHIVDSVTILGDFHKFLATNCLTKWAHIIWWPFGPFLLMSYKKCVAIFWGNFCENLGNFLFHHLVTLLVEQTLFYIKCIDYHLLFSIGHVLQPNIN